MRINGVNHEFFFEENNSKLVKTTNNESTELNMISEFTPIQLENGKTFYPEIVKDSTVLYFWATWCRPCIETLKNINVQELESKGIEIIPIAYNCSGTKEFLKTNSLNFRDLIISEKSAKVYNIKALSKQYTFLKNGKISDENVNLKEYYHNK